MPAERLFLPTLLIATAAITGCADRAQETTARKTDLAAGQQAPESVAATPTKERTAAKSREAALFKVGPPTVGIWDVVSIDEHDLGTWHGIGPDGEDIGGSDWEYTATCRQGDQTRTLALTDELPGPIDVAELPLQTGDRFRIVENPTKVNDPEAISLPGGVTVIKVPADTQQARGTFPRLYPFREAGPDGQWGYIDTKGTILIEPAYRLAGDFVGGRARVTKSEKSGYIDEDGHWVFTLPEGWAVTRPFSEGFAGVSVGSMYSGKWGYLDRDGNMVVQPKYDQIGEFVEGLARVNMGAQWEFPGAWKGGKWGFIDTSGRVVISIQFDYACDFSSGQASVKKQGRWFHIDRQGHAVTGRKPKEPRATKTEDMPNEFVRTADGEMKQANDREAFRGDLARVHIGGGFSVEDDGGAEWGGGAWYYVNRKGEIVRRVRNDDEGEGCGYGTEDR